jgi:DHA3 family tetracycline resistance protein-like MFS transporter
MLKLPRSLSAERAYYLLSATQALAFAVMYTTYTVFFVQVARLDPLQLVLVGTALEVAYFLLEIPTGIVADAYSRRLSILLGVLCLGLSSVLISLWPTFGIILLGQVVSAAGYAYLSGATTAWLAGEVGEVQTGALLIRAGQLGRVASLIGIGLGVALASVALPLTYLAGGLLLLVLSGVLAVAMPETGFQPLPREDRNTWQTMWRGFRQGALAVRAAPLLLLLLGVEFFIGASSEGFDRLGDAHLLANFTFPTLGALQPVAWFGVFGVAGTLLSLAVVEPLRQRLERLSRKPSAIALGLLAFDALSTVSALIFALTDNFWLAVAAMLLRGVGFALGEPLFQAWLVQNTQSEVRATMLSVVGQTNALGQIAGGPGVGLVGSLFGLRAALTLAALLMTPALPFYLRAAAMTPPPVSTAEPESA